MYVDFTYYSGIYGGTILDDQAFSGAVREAETYIRYLTCLSGNIFEDATQADTIKSTVCAAADTYYMAVKEATENGSIKSESKDGFSASFVVARKDGETVDSYVKRCMYQVIRTRLLPTGWFSRKARCGYAHECRCCDNL